MEAEADAGEAAGPPAPAASAATAAFAGAAPVRALIWLMHMALPLLGLWLLIARPGVDGVWEHHPAHFWLVAGIALMNVALGLRISQAARQRDDARLFLVSLAFLSSAGFLGLHALATPRVVLDTPNAGFVVATPVGLLIAAVFAAASSFDFTPAQSAALMRRAWLVVAALVAAMLAWGAASLLEAPPLRDALMKEEADSWLRGLAIPGIVLYALAAGRYYLLHRRRPAVMLISVITAFVLLAEALFAMIHARNWHASWWEWHLLMGAAFGFVAYSANVQYWQEGASTALFRGISLEETVRQIRDEYTAALEGLVRAIQERVEGEEAGRETGPVAARLAARYGLSESQRQVLEEAAQALAAEREQIRRLDALVTLGHQSRVMIDEAEMIERAAAVAGRAAGRHQVRIGLLRDGELTFTAAARDLGQPDAIREDAIAQAMSSLDPVEVRGDGAAALMVLPLTVKSHAVGVIEVARARGEFTDRDRGLLQSFANQLSVAIENTRLYRQLDTLFRSYMSPDVATALLADPSQAALGGEVVEVTVLFADLRGFTSFSERSSPGEVVELLNACFARAVPVVLERGGTVTHFAGDALMALFNAPARQPDHALRAARAALALQASVAEVAPGRDDAPRFRVGVNTGPALVGNIGSDELRHYTAIGDAVNVASRLETAADPGQVLIGAATRATLGDAATVTPVGPLQLKGKEDPVEAFVLTALRE